MSESPQTAEAARARFRRTLFQVLVVQAVSLVALGLLQIVYGG